MIPARTARMRLKCYEIPTQSAGSLSRIPMPVRLIAMPPQRRRHAMQDWRPRWTLKIGLRLLGLALLATLWPEGRALAALAHGHPAVTIGQLSLAALAFLCASGGMALLLMGPDLWKPVRLADRWTAR